MLFNLFRKKPSSKTIEANKKLDPMVCTYKMYSIKNAKKIYYIECEYEKVMLRAVVDCSKFPKEDFKSLRSTIINNKLNNIIKEANQHSLCSYPKNRSGGSMMKFIWDESKIVDTNVNTKKLNLLYAVCGNNIENGKKIPGGMSECYYPIV